MLLLGHKLRIFFRHKDAADSFLQLRDSFESRYLVERNMLGAEVLQNCKCMQVLSPFLEDGMVRYFVRIEDPILRCTILIKEDSLRDSNSTL